MKKICLISLFFYICSTPLFSQDFPKIFGCFCEGGVILGKIKKDDSIKIGNKKLDIFDNGEFIFAFGRKHKSEVIISYNDVKKTYVVKKKKYKIGYDPKLFTRKTLNIFLNKNVKLKAIKNNLIDKIWKRNSKAKVKQFYSLPKNSVGENYKLKINKVVKNLKKNLELHHYLQ